MVAGGEGCLDDGLQPMTVPRPCFLVDSIAMVTVRTLQEMFSFPPVPSSRHVALTDTSVGTEQALSHPLFWCLFSSPGGARRQMG